MMKRLLTTLTAWLLSASLACAQVWFPTPNPSVNAQGSVQMCLNAAGTAYIACGVAAPNLVANSQIIYTQSTGNSSVAQLAGSATFTGTTDAIINEQIISVNMTNDQPITLIIHQCIYATCTADALPTFTRTVAANQGLNEAWAINGNYVYVTAQNTSGTLTTTFNLNVYYGPSQLPYTPSGNAAVGVMEQSAPIYMPGQTFVSAASGNQANATATATCAAVPAKANYLTGYDIEAAGATAAAVVNPTITGILGGTRTMTFAAPLGAVVAAQPLMQTFNPPLQGSAVNTAISVSMPALGTGATNATVNAQCFYQ
jgi:hypothetical protein